MNNTSYGMPAPKTRMQFEHNLFLLSERSNRIVNSDDMEAKQNYVWATYPHVKKIRHHPNGRFDFLTIDEGARLQANMQHWMEFMNPYQQYR